jgi:hypothetical protein
VRENSACFARRQYDGQLGRACDALDIADEIEFLLEHLLIEKQECCESSVLRRGSDMFFSCEMSKKFRNFFLAHFVWMSFAMEQDDSADPINVHLLSPNGVMFDTQVPADAAE